MQEQIWEDIWEDIWEQIWGKISGQILEQISEQHMRGPSCGLLNGCDPSRLIWTAVIGVNSYEKCLDFCHDAGSLKKP